MSNLITLTPDEFCKATAACAEGREFALRYKTMAEVWDACPEVDWLLWICRKVDRMPDDRTLRLFAIWCARNTPLGDGRVTGDLLTDPRSLAALEVAERYAHGQATDEELAAARAAAATVAASAAYAASAYAASAYVASAYAYAYAAVVARRAAARQAQADQFRRMVGNPFRT